MSATILIADDEPSIAALVADCLEAEGYRVLLARDGVEALAALESERPDLLLTDHLMPRLSGLALIDRMRASPGLAMPVILMTATPAVPIPPRVALLRKPFGVDALLALVASVLPVA